MAEVTLQTPFAQPRESRQPAGPPPVNTGSDVFIARTRNEYASDAPPPPQEPVANVDRVRFAPAPEPLHVGREAYVPPPAVGVPDRPAGEGLGVVVSGSRDVSFSRSAPAVTTGDVFVPPAPAGPLYAAPPWWTGQSAPTVSNEPQQLVGAGRVMNVDGDVRIGLGALGQAGAPQPVRLAGTEDVHMVPAGPAPVGGAEVGFAPAAAGAEPLNIGSNDVRFGGRGEPLKV